MTIMTSALEEEFAMDAGEGQGGRWTNYFFGKGRPPAMNHTGKEIEGIAGPGEEAPY